MVKLPQTHKLNNSLHGEPPPIDESWWEAVLAEEEAKNLALSQRKSSQSQITPPLKTGRPTTDLPGVDWPKAVEIYEKDQTISLLVTSFNRGGLLVNGDGLQGFVPVSHLVNTPAQPGDVDAWLSTYLEHRLRLKIIECDPERGRVVFSERAALAEPGTRNSLLQNLQPGDQISGTITNVTDFGVFVDLGGVEGLVHVSEISWGRVHHPADVVKVGEEVQVFVIQVDRERARIALSLKRLYPNPWETAEARYFPGQITEAVVTSVVPFGAFARLEEGLDGLIHISEMDCNGASSQPMELLTEGQQVRVRVLHVDGVRQRLGLSLKVEEAL
jgi:small subunit ribosomal protein S1